jgi:hypothetical protein
MADTKILHCVFLQLIDIIMFTFLHAMQKGQKNSVL